MLGRAGQGDVLAHAAHVDGEPVVVPGPVVLARVDVHRLVGTAVHRQVGLAVSREVDDAQLDRRRVDPGLADAAVDWLPAHLTDETRFTHEDGHDLRHDVGGGCR